MPVRYPLALALLPFVTVPARAGEFAPVPPPPGMALTSPKPAITKPAVPKPAMADSEAVRAPTPASSQIDPGEGQRHLRALGAGFPSLGGQLPNQRTGSRRQHVVNDICIGC